MKRVVERYVTGKIHKFAEKSDRTEFTNACKDLLEPFAPFVRETDVYFDANSYEEQRYIIHCYMSVVFKTTLERAIIEIDINPRV